MTEKLQKSKLEPIEQLDSESEFDSWSPETAETLNELLRALRRKKGFGLFFVQCNPAQGQRVIAAIKDGLPQKRLIQVELHRESETLYGELLERYQTEPFEIVCITGAEQAMYGYEDTKRLAGWTSDEIYNYSWKGLPPLLSHLNRQREAFEENLPIDLIFLVPSFVIDYFIQRAPDFFDWRSGFFRFEESIEDLQRVFEELASKRYEEYLDLTAEERMKRILEIKDKILQLEQSDYEQKSNLFREQGRLFRSGGDLIHALDCCDRATNVCHENHKAWNSKGNLLYQLERYEEALASYESALSIKRDYYPAWFNQGNSLYMLKRFEEALESYNHALKLKPEKSAPWGRRGDVLRSLKRFEEALESYKKALEVEPKNANGWSLKGETLSKLSRYDEALESYNRALEINPNHSASWGKKGDSLSKLGKFEEALKSYEKALKIERKNFYGWILKGGVLNRLERYDEALESYSRALDLRPDSCYALNLMGRTLHQLNRYQDALIKYNHSLKIQPEYLPSLRGKGGLSYEIGRHCEALDCFAKVCEIQPSDKFAWNNQGYLLLAHISYGLQPVFEKPLLIRQDQILDGSVCHEAKNTEFSLEICEKALRFFDVALKIDPDLALAWASRSFPAYYLGHYQNALEACNKALELASPNREAMNDVIYSNQGFILLQIQSPVDALNAFDTALTLNPQLDEAWIGKGSTLYQLERYEEAIHSFTQALHLNHPLAQANLDLLQDCLN